VPRAEFEIWLAAALPGKAADIGDSDGRTCANRSSRIQPDQFRRLLLMIRPARPTLAEVPLADLSFFTAEEDEAWRNV
jgi:hypothetical protein